MSTLDTSWTDAKCAAAPAGNSVLRAARLLAIVSVAFLGTCTSTEESAEGIWVALHANSVRELPSGSLLPMGRLRPDGSWDLPWPKSFGVSFQVTEQASLVPIDSDGFLLPPRNLPDGPARPGIHWLLPYEVADSARLRSVAPVRWYRYAVGEGVQGHTTQANALWHADYPCAFWVLRVPDGIDASVPAAMALSRPALRNLSAEDLPDLDAMLTAAGFPHEPADSDGGYHFEGDGRNPAGRYPRRAVAGLASIREDMDVALVRYEEVGARFGGRVTTWALVQLVDGTATVVSTFSAGDTGSCTRWPAEDRNEALWVALVSQQGTRLEPIGRRHPDGRWDLPWPDVVLGAGLDSSGYLHPWEEPSDEPRNSDPGWPLPFRQVGGDRVRIDVPLHWYRYGRLHAVPGAVTHVMLSSRHCLAGWSLRMDPAPGLAGPAGRDVGVAFSSPLAVQLTEQEIPGLESILAALGLLDKPPLDQGGYEKADNRYPRRQILGLYRVGDDVIVGVVGEYHYEGERRVVFEITRDSARIVSEASGGGC